MKIKSYLLLFAVLAAALFTGCINSPLPVYYNITMSDDGNGTAAATVGGNAATSSEAGETVTITATPDSGYLFAGWTVLSGGVSLASITASPTTFVMPDTDVEIRADFVVEYAPTIYYFTESNDANSGFYSVAANNVQGGTRLGGVTTDVQCMEYIDGTLYGITYSSSSVTNDLITVDPANGAITVVEAGIAADGIGMAVNPLTGKVYVSTWDSKFGTIDLATGAYTNIATWAEKFTIAIDNDGICYAQAIPSASNAKFGIVDLETGAFTQLTTRPNTVAYVQNMGVDRQTNELYWIERNSTVNRLNKVDKTSGESTALGLFPRSIQSIAIF